MAGRLVAALKAGAASGAPLIGLDPAFVMALPQDYRKAGRDAPEVLLPQEFLAAEIRRGVTLPQMPGGQLSLFTHCTESSGAPTARKDWEDVFVVLGLQIDTPATGCCGMAGMFGHKKRHQLMSRKLFDLSWAEPFAKADQAVATGFSCRCQIERLTGETMRHPLGLIADRLGQVGAALSH